MARECSCCNHQEIKAIDQSLREHVSTRRIQELFGVGRASVARHKRHMANPPAAREGQASEDAVETIDAPGPFVGSILERLKTLELNTHRQGLVAEKKGHLQTAVAAAKVVGWLLEFEARLTHEIEQVPTNVFNFQMCDGFRRAAEARRAQTIDVQPVIAGKESD